MTRFTSYAVAVLLASACGSPAADYPRSDLLVEPVALVKPETLKGFVVLDARPKAKYEAGHVPGARWVDHADWAKSFGNGQDAAGWSKRIGSLGLTADSRVIVYEGNQAKDAAHIWWVLRYWCVKDVRLLNGGWVGWEKGKHPTEKAEPAITASDFKAVAAPERMRRRTNCSSPSQATSARSWMPARRASSATLKG